MIVTGPVVTTVTDASFAVAWETDVPCISILRYTSVDSLEAPRPAVADLGATIVDSAYVTHHELMASGLNPGTQYMFHVAAVDTSGNGEVVSVNAIVATRPEADLDPPVVVAQPTVMGFVVTDINTINVTITWMTDEPAVGRLTYGGCEPLALYGIAQSAAEPTTTHEVQLTNLVPGARYCYTVRATDLAGNVGGTTVAEFMTPAGPDIRPPLLTTQPTILGITHSSITVGWMTDEPATTIVEYGTTDSLGRTLVDRSLSTEHQVIIRQLAAGTQYYIRVLSADIMGNVTAWNLPEPINTHHGPDEFPPTFLSAPVFTYVGDTFAVFQWYSDEPAISTIWYGTDSSSLDGIVYSNEFTVQHMVTLRDLTPGTGYTVEVEMRDAAGNGPVTIPLQFYTKESPLAVAESPPTAFALHQNAPNPFNPSTTITFSLPDAGRTVLTIYNAGGQPVRTLVDAEVAGGMHHVEWDGRDSGGRAMASGVYICRLSWSGESLSDSDTNASPASVRRLVLAR